MATILNLHDKTEITPTNLDNLLNFTIPDFSENLQINGSLILNSNKSLSNAQLAIYDTEKELLRFFASFQYDNGSLIRCHAHHSPSSRNTLNPGINPVLILAHASQSLEDTALSKKVNNSIAPIRIALRGITPEESVERLLERNFRMTSINQMNSHAQNEMLHFLYGTPGRYETITDAELRKYLG